jgi:aconitase B
MRGVIDVLVRQIKSDDLVAVGVDADMRFVLGAAFRSSVLF